MVILMSEHMRLSRRSQDFEEKEIDLMSRGQKRTEAQKCGHDIKLQNNEQRWPMLGIIRMNVIWTTKVGDHPENKQVSSVKSAASSPGAIIRECQNRQEKYAEHVPIWTIHSSQQTRDWAAVHHSRPDLLSSCSRLGTCPQVPKERQTLTDGWGRGRVNGKVVSITEAQEREQQKHPPKQPDCASRLLHRKRKVEGKILRSLKILKTGYSRLRRGTGESNDGPH
ncbi:hypothetical protein EDB92DRAFT_1823614 [Lactarius akahatsu]|uniref:Uncharacterized protein n=1 Tax=Lactarius akahatsu TaxID=416441 RepID=A0AAD4L3Y0_9AGAM|nr:hypothetical protein EDB92DRAFT_1823614 [Lactarius akahatsu]